MNRTANKNHIVYITRTTAPYKQHIYPYKKNRITDVMNPYFAARFTGPGPNTGL